MLSNTFKAYNKKPTDNEPSKNLFAIDVSFKSGAKNFLFETYQNIYNYIITHEISYFYEDTTFSNNTTGIKLHIDFDYTYVFNTELDRNNYIENFIINITTQINNKIFNTFNISNTPHIILVSDTLLKASFHIIYPEIIFKTIYEMKIFLCGIEHIDQNIYKIGCFRMMFCSKINKYNKLLYYNSYNYIIPNDKYTLFLAVLGGVNDFNGRY